MKEPVIKNIADFETDGVLKPVAEVASKIANYLGALGIVCDAQVYNSSILIIMQEDEPISFSTFSTATEDFTAPGVVISFNETEQIIRVAPFKN